MKILDSHGNVHSSWSSAQKALITDLNLYFYDPDEDLDVTVEVFRRLFRQISAIVRGQNLNLKEHIGTITFLHKSIRSDIVDGDTDCALTHMNEIKSTMEDMKSQVYLP